MADRHALGGPLVCRYGPSRAYAEEGGGAALDLEVDDTVSQRLWADARLMLGTNFEFSDGGKVTPYISAGYRANVIDEAAERTLRFVSGSQDFTLIVETTGSGGAAPRHRLSTPPMAIPTFSIAYEGEFSATRCSVTTSTWRCASASKQTLSSAPSPQVRHMFHGHAHRRRDHGPCELERGRSEVVSERPFANVAFSLINSGNREILMFVHSVLFLALGRT